MMRGKEALDGRYRVRMEVLLDNVLLISGKRLSDGQQFDLYTGG
jgi:hypothetical protein